MRLNKFIALCGVASRRGADEIIANGRVTVNGSIVQTMGVDIDTQNDLVCVDGKTVRPQTENVYIMLNKPAGTICACSDDRGRQTVVDLISGIDARVFPVGRLDYDTEGLLLLTNDGDFAYRCTHPKHEISKTYFAVVKGILNDHAIKTLCGGVVIDGYKTSRAEIEVRERTSKRTEILISIHEGRNRQIKKMFQLVGCRVTFLKRVAVGKLQIGSLGMGEWRMLERKEIAHFD